MSNEDNSNPPYNPPPQQPQPGQPQPGHPQQPQQPQPQQQPQPGQPQQPQPGQPQQPQQPQPGQPQQPQPGQPQQPQQPQPGQPQQPRYVQEPTTTPQGAPQQINSIFDLAPGQSHVEVDESVIPPEVLEEQKRLRQKEMMTKLAKTAGIVAGIIGIIFVGIFIYSLVTKVTPGSSKPENVINNSFKAISNQDLLGALRQVDPHEVEPLIENYNTFTNFVAENEETAISSNNPLEGLDFSFETIETETVMYSADIARVELLGGKINVKLDESKLPDNEIDTAEYERTDIAELNKAWKSGEGFIVDQDNFKASNLESQNIFYVAVKRDGRWYFSSLYTAAEYLRIIGNANGGDYQRPTFDPSKRIGNGSDNPEDAVVNFIESIAGVDVTETIKATAPDRFSIAYDYLETATQAEERNQQNEYLQAARDGIKVIEIKTDEIEETPLRSFIKINSLILNIDYNIDVKPEDLSKFETTPYAVRMRATWDGSCVRYNGAFSIYNRIFEQPDPSSSLDQDLLPTDDEDSYSEPEYTFESSTEQVNERECFRDFNKGDLPDLGFVTIKEEEKFYVSPVDTLWAYAFWYMNNVK